MGLSVLKPGLSPINCPGFPGLERFPGTQNLENQNRGIPGQLEQVGHLKFGLAEPVETEELWLLKSWSIPTAREPGPWDSGHVTTADSHLDPRA